MPLPDEDNDYCMILRVRVVRNPAIASGLMVVVTKQTRMHIHLKQVRCSGLHSTSSLTGLVLWPRGLADQLFR